MLTNAANWFIDLLYTIASFALSILPDTPFRNDDWDLSQFTLVMGWINYFVPIGAFVNITLTFTFAVALWYVARWFLRLVKYID